MESHLREVGQHEAATGWENMDAKVRRSSKFLPWLLAYTKKHTNITYIPSWSSNSSLWSFNFSHSTSSIFASWASKLFLPSSRRHFLFCIWRQKTGLISRYFHHDDKIMNICLFAEIMNFVIMFYGCSIKNQSIFLQIGGYIFLG